SSLPAVTFYLFAQRQLYPKNWIKELLLMPVLTALGVGVSLNNSRAVLEALLDYETGFTRTPKYGIEKNKLGVRAPRYAPLKSLLTVVEIIFALYFGYLCLYALQHAEYGALP